MLMRWSQLGGHDLHEFCILRRTFTTSLRQMYTPMPAIDIVAYCRPPDPPRLTAREVRTRTAQLAKHELRHRSREILRTAAWRRRVRQERVVQGSTMCPSSSGCSHPGSYGTRTIAALARRWLSVVIRAHAYRGPRWVPTLRHRHGGDHAAAPAPSCRPSCAPRPRRHPCASRKYVYQIRFRLR